MKYLFIILFAFCTGVVNAQIQGSANVMVGSSVTYYYDDGTVYVGVTWSITNGTSTATWQTGTRYFVTVSWTTAGTGQVRIRENGGTIDILYATVTNPSLPAPVATAASNPDSESFTANWQPVTGATGYRLDVATDNSFSTFVPNYNNKPVTGTSAVVSGLTDHATYYYRVRATTSTITSPNSNVIFAGDFDQNYIRTTITQKSGITTVAQLAPLTNLDKSVTTEIFDGLGRLSQYVSWQSTPAGKDIIVPHVYDVLNREIINYLPYVSSETNGWYKLKPLGTSGYTSSPHYLYHNNGSSDRVTDDIRPFSELRPEASPLSRIVEQSGVGDVWKHDAVDGFSSTDYTMKKAYETNVATEVLMWSFTSPISLDVTYPFGFVNAGSSNTNRNYYPAGTLYKERSKDEQGFESIEFLDKGGCVVLKKVQVSSTLWAETYYVYDNFGSLICVIPPEGTKLITKSTSNYFGMADNIKNTFMSTWGFQYAYDARRRLVMKRVPGGKVERMVYDNLDRLAMTQDAVQKPLNQWTFTKYDVYDRPILTGIYTHATNEEQWNMKTLVSDGFETYNGTTTYNGYTNTIFPTSGTILNVNYFDDYQFLALLGGGTSWNYKTGDLTGQEPTNFDRVKGKQTGSKVNVLGSATYLWSVTYFDTKYRPIQVIFHNNKGGVDVDRTTNLYDFVKLVQTKTIHVKGTNTYTVKRRFLYDHAIRLKQTFHTFNTEPEVLISENMFNEIGQLITKKIHSRSASAFLQTTDYAYNIRGWLTNINDPATPEITDLFSMQLKYQSPGTNGGTAQYNGNISEIIWKAPGFNQQSYGYYYDTLR